jgi:HK97 family phage portal protein
VVIVAFKLFNKRSETTPEIRDNTAGDTPSDVLLTTLIKGGSISREQVLTIPAVSANIDFISNSIASMPVKLYRYKQGKVEEVTNDSRVRLLNCDTGDTLDAFQLKKALVEDYFLSTGGYCFIQKNRNEVTGLYYVENEYVVVNYNFEPIYKDYFIYVGKDSYKPYEFIKLLRNTKTGAFGVSITKELSTALETAYQTQLYQLGLVKTGGNKRGFLKSERKLGQAEIDALKAAWRRLYANNEESVVVLNNGLDFKEAANTSVEMQLNESIKTLQEQIDDIFHISADFNNTFKFAIYPIIKAFETALNRDLLLEKEKGKYFFEFDVKEIIKASIKERYEVYRMSKECQMTTINERRRMENMNEIEGGDVIDLGLGAVLFDVKTQTYYTPNTGSKEDIKTVEEESFIDDLNDSERATTGEQMSIEDLEQEEANE